jgi:hypothetical protein
MRGLFLHAEDKLGLLLKNRVDLIERVRGRCMLMCPFYADYRDTPRGSIPGCSFVLLGTRDPASRTPSTSAVPSLTSLPFPSPVVPPNSQET